jgi:hypothetical protein
MWNVKTKVIPVIIGVTGIISKSFRKYLSYMSGKHDFKKLPCTLTSESTNVKVQNIERWK